jgi:hypothetical protein
MRLSTSILISALWLCACATTRQAGNQEDFKTSVRVENRNFLDMKIYILRGAERIRIGTVTGNSTQVFTIPEGLIFGSGLVRFLADPIGGTDTPISQEISVRQGDVVELIITN